VQQVAARLEDSKVIAGQGSLANKFVFDCIFQATSPKKYSGWNHCIHY